MYKNLRFVNDIYPGNYSSILKGLHQEQYSYDILTSMNISSWCDRVIKIGFYLLFILVPIILTPINYELFEYNKMIVTYALTVIIVGAWVIKMVRNKEIRIAKTPFDIPILLFVSSQFVSALFSMDPHVSWFGYYSRFNGGMWSVISYVLLYYAFVSNFSMSSFLADIEKLKTSFEKTQDKQNSKVPSERLGTGKTSTQNSVSEVTEEESHPSTSLRTSNKTIINLLKVTLSTASVVAIYGVLEHFGIDKHLWVQDVQNRVFSTLGQPNWLAAYLVALTPIAMALGLQFSIKRLLLVIGYWSLVMLFFLVLLYTRSRSGLVGFAAADLIFWGLVFFFVSRFNLVKNKVKPFQNKSLAFVFIICHLSFAIIVFLNGTNIDAIDKFVTLKSWQNRLSNSTFSIQNPAFNVATPSGTLLETGGTESGTIRKYVWQGAYNAWNSSLKTRLIGTGTESFAFAFYQFKPKEHNLTSEWDFLYNKAHNEYLNYLATTGILGLGSYLLFIGSIIWWFIKMLNAKCQMLNKNESKLPPDLPFIIQHSSFSIALFAGWISILVTNFFGFSVVVVQLLFFLLPALMLTLSSSVKTDKQNLHYALHLPLSDSVAKMLSLPILFLFFVVLFLISRMWYADTLFASGYRASRAGLFQKAYPNLKSSIKLNSEEPLYHDEFATVLAGLAVEAIQDKNATAAATYAKQSLQESDEAISISPNNVNFWKSRTKIYYSFSSFDPIFNKAAIESLAKALTLSPNDPKIMYNLAILYGRGSDNTKAIDLLKNAIIAKPNYRDAYWALAIFYGEVKQPELAKTILTQYINRVDPTDKEFLEKLNE